MELTSIVNYKWKLCLFFGSLSCLILFLLNQNYQTQKFAIVQEFIPDDNVAEGPTSIIISEPTMLFTISPSPTVSVIQGNEIKQPKSTQTDYRSEETTNKNTYKKCNIFDGRWVYNPNANPYYDSNTCPFIEEKMNCQNNGRPDFQYQKWRWEPKDCDIPLFDGRDMLERLRNKRVILVGDSLNRNMWESLACLLYISVHSSRTEVDAKGSDYKVFKAKDYNALIEFYWSPFLIDFDQNHTSGKKVLVLEKLSPNFKQWRGADVMIFNSGAWWTHTGKLKAWDLFQYKGQLFEDMPIEKAYDRAMKTWTKWVQKKVDSNKSTVFFQSISAQHNQKQWCYNATQPFMDESFEKTFPKSLTYIIESLIRGMSNPQVKYLNITKLSEYRIDAHSSIYWSNSKWKNYSSKYKKFISSFADCIHWCLPGLPDTWNELLYASLYFYT